MAWVDSVRLRIEVPIWLGPRTEGTLFRAGSRTKLAWCGGKLNYPFVELIQDSEAKSGPLSHSESDR